MTTFLQIVRDAALESGTVPSAASLPTLAGQSDRVNRFAGWVRDAWLDIQRSRERWLWMERPFTAPVIPGFAEQDAGGMGIERFGGWRLLDEDGYTTLTVFDHERGHRSEIVPLSEDHFRRLSDAVPGAPRRAAVTRQDRLILAPTPDLPYLVSGFYRLSPQVLGQDGDIPEMPERFHEAIRWRALERMALYDEDGAAMEAYRRRAASIIVDLERNQLPAIRVGRALA